MRHVPIRRDEAGEARAMVALEVEGPAASRVVTLAGLPREAIMANREGA